MYDDHSIRTDSDLGIPISPPIQQDLMACVACHKAKVKCEKRNHGNGGGGGSTSEASSSSLTTTDNNSSSSSYDAVSCARCTRMGLECVPHISQQGKSIIPDPHGSKRRKTSVGITSLSVSGGGGPIHALILEKSVVKQTRAKDTHHLHFGLNHLIRQWMCLAVSRRSFRLQEIAGRLANKLGISMDQVYCGQGYPSTWKSWDGRDDLSLRRELAGNICQPTSFQDVGHYPLEQSEIPMLVFRVMRCVRQVSTTTTTGIDGTTTTTMTEVVDLTHRWIMIRECKVGQARFYGTPDFSRDFCTPHEMQQTWIANKHEVKALFMPSGKNIHLYGESFFHQISLQTEPGIVNVPDRVTGVTIRMKNGTIVPVEFICWISIVSLDHAYIAMEFVRKPTPKAATVPPLPGPGIMVGTAVEPPPARVPSPTTQEGEQEQQQQQHEESSQASQSDNLDQSQAGRTSLCPLAKQESKKNVQKMEGTRFVCHP